MKENSCRPVEILLVEDSEVDIRLTGEAFKEGKLRHNLSVVRDGEEAMRFLRQEGDFSEAPRPDLILLDLNMPRMDGREVLSEIKKDNNLRRIPVVVLTTSRAEEDVLKSYDLHANCYVTKPVDMYQFLDVIECIEEFWLTIVVLPSRSGI